MSKRSFRRLAVVAGAALAVGSMAPAMASRIEVTGQVEADSAPSSTSLDPLSILGSIQDAPDYAGDLVFSLLGEFSWLGDAGADNHDCLAIGVGCIDGPLVNDVNVLSYDGPGGGSNANSGGSNHDCAVVGVGCIDGPLVNDVNVLSVDGPGGGPWLGSAGVGSILGPVAPILVPVHQAVHGVLVGLGGPGYGLDGVLDVNVLASVVAAL